MLRGALFGSEMIRQYDKGTEEHNGTGDT
ncbi:hypothetical protein NTGHW29_310001 [Candidatus Nitrotoga sp. HW29]|nr:hypothetical protein NTGHW29_310001 [Candidatus Nitrotoga sp. HW29]